MDSPPVPDPTEFDDDIDPAEVYGSLNRGHVDSHPNSALAVQPCDQVYLETLLHDLRTVRNIYILDFKNASRDDLKLRVDTIGKECKRLDEFPSLFPDQKTMGLFFHKVHTLCEQIVEVINIWNGWEKHQKEIMEERLAAEKAHRTQNFPVDRKHPGWDTFLKDGAPGYMAGRAILGRRGFDIVQCLPPAAMKILSMWHTDIRGFFEHLEATQRNGPPSIPRFIAPPLTFVFDQSFYSKASDTKKLIRTNLPHNGLYRRAISPYIEPNGELPLTSLNWILGRAMFERPMNPLPHQFQLVYTTKGNKE